MRALVMILSTLLFAQPVLSSADEPLKVSRYFSGELSGMTFSGKDFSYTWRYAAYDGRRPEEWVGGDSLDPPGYVVESISLELAGKRITIPASAYSDIYDPAVYTHGPYLMEDKAAVYLVINASDGAGAAEVWLRIEGGIYAGRVVKWGEE